MTPAAIILVLVLSLGVVTGCVTPAVTMAAPEGFAAYETDETFSAVSPEGVFVRARKVANDPPQTLSFWSELLERHLTSSGYLLVEKGEFMAADSEGFLFEWLAPVREDDWIFLTAISVIGDSIVVVESAGPTELYSSFRSAIYSSLNTLALSEPKP
jgi:hypothetical protein